MASYYVDSNAGGAGTGADWANAFTTLSAAFSGKAAGDIFYVAHNHAQSTAGAVTSTSPGTPAAPCFIYCVNSGGTVPPVAADLRTTATVTATGANSITFGAQSAYYYGISFRAGSGGATGQVIVSTAATRIVFEECLLAGLSTNAQSPKISFGTQSTDTQHIVRLINTDFQFGHIGDTVAARNHVYWRGGTIQGAVYPTTLFRAPDMFGHLLVEGCDLSVLSTGKTLIGAGTAPHRAVFKGCKLDPSVTLATAPANPSSGEAIFVNCDSGDTNYRTEKVAYGGALTTETTVVRTGGASDGTTPIAWKIITTADAKWLFPFECLPITIWNDTTGSRTITVECRGAAVPNDNEVWMDVAYPGTSGFPLDLISTTGLATPLTTAAACTSSSETWGGGTSSFKLVSTVTVNEKGPITVYVKIGKASSTFYVDPKITLS